MREGGDILVFFFIISSLYFIRFTKIGPRFLSGLKAKLIYATRATRGHQKVGV